MARYYAELAISFLAMAVSISSTDCAYLPGDGHADLALEALFNAKTLYPLLVKT